MCNLKNQSPYFCAKLITLVFICSCFVIKAQKIDSLLKLINSNAIDTVRANALNDAANIYCQRSDYDKALEMCKEALKIYQNRNNRLEESYVLGNIANILNRLREYDEAIKYYKKAITIKIEIGDRKGEALLYSNIAALFFNQMDFNKSIEYCNKSLDLEKVIGDKKVIINCKSNIGSAYIELKKYDQALVELVDAFKLSNEIRDTSKMAMTLSSIGELKLNTHEFKEAIEIFNQSLNLIEKSQEKYLIALMYQGLYNGYKGIGQYDKALGYLEMVLDLNQKMFSDEMAAKVTTLKDQLIAEQNEKEITLLKEKEITANALAEKGKLWIITACSFAAILLLSLVLIITINNSRKKQKELAFIKTKAELEQTALLAQMNPHFIFNALNSIQYYILSKETEYAYDYLAKFSKLIRQVLINSEQNIIALNKEIETLQLYIELEQRRLKNRFDFEINYASDFPAHDITIPTMLIQPFVENAIWHGIMNMPEDKKGRIVLDFSLIGKQLRISVEDNGVGRKEAALRKVNNEYKSVGVMFTQKRLELLKAVSKQQSEIIITDLTDDSGKATGTKVEILMEIVA